MPEERQQLIERYLHNNLPQKKFCQQENISYSTFSYWLKKYRNQHNLESSPEPFISIEPKRETPAAVLEFPGGLTLRIY